MRTLFFCLLLMPAWLPAQPLVVGSIEPLSLALRELYGDAVTVETLMLPQQTPHQAAFTPAQARLVQRADLLVWLGAEAEPALASLVARREGPVLALQDLPGIVRLASQNDDHQHGGADHAGHSHGALGDDPHLWLSPQNMMRLADALAEAEPAVPAGRRDAFRQSLQSLTDTVQQRLSPLRNRPWLSAHDPWLYFHQHFGLRPPLVISPGVQSGTSARRFAELVSAIREQQVGCAIVEPDTGRALMMRLCQAPDCHVEALDPLARDAHHGSYTAFIARIGEGFARCLGSAGQR